MALRTLDQVEADPVYQAMHPKGKQFMRAALLPAALNPYAASHDIQMYALVPFGVFPHIKAIPAFQMLYDDLLAKKFKGKYTLVVDSSGNTADGAALLARAFGFKKLKLVMSNDVPASKTGILRSFGEFVDVLQVANPREVALELGRLPGHYHLDQYSHQGNPRAHRLYTGPEIDRVIGREATGREISVISAAMGSSGTALGIAQYFASRGDETIVLGVRPKPGEQVPGARNKKAMELVRLPWEDYISVVEEVDRRESFRRSRRLWAAVSPRPGPTSGMAWAGLEQFLAKLDAGKRLHELRGTSVAFICPDDGRFYADLMLSELDPNEGVE